MSLQSKIILEPERLQYVRICIKNQYQLIFIEFNKMLVSCVAVVWWENNVRVQCKSHMRLAHSSSGLFSKIEHVDDFLRSYIFNNMYKYGNSFGSKADSSKYTFYWRGKLLWCGCKPNIFEKAMNESIKRWSKVFITPLIIFLKLQCTNRCQAANLSSLWSCTWS